MKRAVWVLLVLCACGRNRPGVEAGATYFWKVTESTISFGSMCSDEQAFRDRNKPIRVSIDEDVNGNSRLDTGEDVNGNGQLDGPSYFVYQGSMDAKKATLMSCTALSATACTAASSGVVFDVAGAELSYSTEKKTPTGLGGCNQLDSQSWILTDKLSTIDVDISDTLGLVDDATACDMIEQSAKAASPNGMGYQGCTITFSLKGADH